MANLFTEKKRKTIALYTAYREFINELLSQQKATGTTPRYSCIEYTKLNVRCLDKGTRWRLDLIPLQEKLSQPWAWCVQHHCEFTKEGHWWYARDCTLTLHSTKREDNSLLGNLKLLA